MTAREEMLNQLRKLAAPSGGRAQELVRMAEEAEDLRAEAHPLGMYAVYFPLASSTIRLHVWTPVTLMFRDTLGQIHDHIWGLESHILFGSLEHTVFDLQDDRNGQPLWIHDYDRRTLCKTDRRVTARSRNEAVVESGQSYTLEAASVHATRVITPWAATLVRATPSGHRTARIVGGVVKPPTQKPARPEIQIAEVTNTLRSMLESAYG